MGLVCTNGSGIATSAVNPAGTLVLTGNDNDDASAIGIQTNNTTSLTTAGGKLLSLSNGGTEKAYVDYLGCPYFGKNSSNAAYVNVQTSGNSVLLVMRSLNGGSGITFTTTKTVGTLCQEILATSTTGPLALNSSVSDGAGAVSVRLNSPAYTTAGARIVSIQNNSTEKANIDKDGIITAETNKRVACGGGSTGAGVTPNGTVTLEINGTSYYLLTSASA